MTTSTFTSPIDSDTDTNFRAWGSQISAQLAAVGLTQAADTGQIDWTTVSISGYPGSVGYEIWNFNDAAQGTTPIFMKIEYGAASSTSPQMWLTVGPSTDGAGNVTGSLKSNRTTILGYNSITLGQASPSFICYKAASGFLGVALKNGVEPPFGAGFWITRTNDTSGAVTTGGWNVYAEGNPGLVTEFYSQFPGHTPAQIPASGNFSPAGGFSVWPLSATSSAADGDIQAQPVFAMSPAIQVNAQLCSVIATEVPVGNQFTLNVVGLTPRNFIATSGDLITTGYNVAMIWE
jgi:hypothetical protein